MNILEKLFTTSISKDPIRSGQPYLFRRDGLPSMVNEIRLNQLVNGELLQLAVTKTLIRYPYLSNSIEVRDGEFYFKRNMRKISVIKSNTLRALGSEETNNHLLDITYNNNIIYVSYHHGMADGRGMKPFIEALLYNYFNEVNHQYIKPVGIQNVGTKLSQTEKEEPLNSKITVENSKTPELKHDAFSIPENYIGEAGNYTRYEFTFDEENFIKFCKFYGATPSIAMSILMSQAITIEHQENEKKIVTNVAVDLRKGATAFNSFRNAVASVELEYYPKSNLNFFDYSKQHRKTLKNFQNNNNLSKELAKLNALSNKIDAIPNFEDKFQIGDMLNNLVVDTFTLSYAGKYNLLLNENYVEGIYAYSSIQKGINSQLIASGKTMTYTFTQSFNSDRYRDSLCKVLQSYNLEYKVDGPIQFRTPKDHIKRINNITTK